MKDETLFSPSFLKAVIQMSGYNPRAKHPEFVFQSEVQSALSIEGFIPRTCKFNTNRGVFFLPSTYYAFPDIVLAGPDGVAQVAIECKPKNTLHMMTQAVGQCMLYKLHVPIAVICVPDENVALDIMTISFEHRIPICTPQTLVRRILSACRHNGVELERDGVSDNTDSLAGPLGKPLASGSVKCLILPEIEAIDGNADGR